MQTYDNRAYWTGLHAARRGRIAAVGYAGLGDGFNDAAYRLRRAAVLRLLGRTVLPVRFRLLEAGAGVGAYASLWRRLKPGRWVGLDIAPEAVEHCRRACPEGEFLLQDLAAAEWSGLPAAEAEFDLVTAIDVLYHLVEEHACRTALANLAARVRPGGFLLISDVFVEADRQIAPHVKRRSLATYRDALGPEMAPAGREPVFSILADATPRSGRDLAGHLQLAAWRLLAKTLSSMPEPARDAAGGAAVAMLRPLDALFRRMGLARGVNLELALFRRRPPCAE